MTKTASKLFDAIDANGNGRITKKEIEDYEKKTEKAVEKVLPEVPKEGCNCESFLVVFNGEEYLCQYCGKPGNHL